MNEWIIITVVSVFNPRCCDTGCFCLVYLIICPLLVPYPEAKTTRHPFWKWIQNVHILFSYINPDKKWPPMKPRLNFSFRYSCQIAVERALALKPAQTHCGAAVLWPYRRSGTISGWALFALVWMREPSGGEKQKLWAVMKHDILVIIHSKITTMVFPFLSTAQLVPSCKNNIHVDALLKHRDHCLR